jgi:uncharacterized protein (UPF0276 family)
MSDPTSSSATSIYANGIGIGLRAPHYAQILESRPALDFLEVHSENFFHAGGASIRVLERVRAHYPMSLHGVGLSLASADLLAEAHLETHLDKLAQLVERVQPALVSEHLCWGGVDGMHFNDLLPFPYAPEALDLVALRVERVQERLKRRILIENLSSYVGFRESAMSECEFMAALARRTGCGVLLDVNNLYVNAQNFGFDPYTELAHLPAHAIGEVHLAGHDVGEHCLIDTHGSRVCDAVWALYENAIARFGPIPTLIEWDTDVPSLEVLLDEAAIARKLMRSADTVGIALNA